MIVDDSEFNRAILKEILEETYEIIEADGGNEALHKIDEYEQNFACTIRYHYARKGMVLKF